MNRPYSKLQELYFPVKEENVFYHETVEETSELLRANRYKAIVGYAEPGTVLLRNTLFGIMSASYNLITNEEFYDSVYEALKEFSNVTDIEINHIRGYFVARFILDDIVPNIGKLGILAINSYDGTASTQLNMFVRVKQGNRNLDMYLDFNFKHKHTPGNKYYKYISILSSKVNVIDKLNTLFMELAQSELSKKEFENLCKRVKLPNMYRDVILETAYQGRNAVSCLTLYMSITTAIESMDEIRKISYLNNILRGMRSMKESIHVLEL